MWYLAAALVLGSPCNLSSENGTSTLDYAKSFALANNDNNNGGTQEHGTGGDKGNVRPQKRVFPFSIDMDDIDDTQEHGTGGDKGNVRPRTAGLVLLDNHLALADNNNNGGTQEHGTGGDKGNVRPQKRVFPFSIDMDDIDDTQEHGTGGDKGNVRPRTFA